MLRARRRDVKALRSELVVTRFSGSPQRPPKGGHYERVASPPMRLVERMAYGVCRNGEALRSELVVTRFSGSPQRPPKGGHYERAAGLPIWDLP